MMSLDEGLAVMRLRQWSIMRAQLHGSKTLNYKRQGWKQRNERLFDARQVTVIDFERTLNRLDADEQLALILRYRDGECDEHIAQVIGCSTRKIGYVLPAARRKLASLLDRLDLL
jgi:DNA-directed RNA polymerase specialized sigma24 family protein